MLSNDQDNTYTISEPTKWFVMVHYGLKRFKDWLAAENVKRLGNDRHAIESFCPYDFLRGDATEDQEKKAAEANSVASDLAHFIFIKATDAEVDELVNEEKKLGQRYTLLYYKDTDGRHAIVEDRMMNDFFEACLKHRSFFEISPPIQGIEAMDKVKIKSGPFAGHQASVVSVRHSKGEIQLELALELVSGEMTIKMSNVSKQQVEILNRSAIDAIRTDFIEYTQNHLLKILERRVKGKEDDIQRQRDVDMLTRLYRYRNHKVEKGAAQTHFLALMLICAHLCRYRADEAQLREKALSTLADINQRSESKATTDTRTYLWIALYVSTYDPSYREAAKQYVRDYQPKSAKLRRFVSLIRTGRKI